MSPLKRFQTRILSLTTALLMLVGTPAFAASDAEQLTILLKRMTSLDADFQQRILDARGSRLQEVSGHLSLSRPGKFFWKTEDPFPQTVVSDGESLWLYDPDLEQVTVQQVQDQQQGTPAMLLSGQLDQLQERFTIQLTRDADQFQEYLLIPKGQESLFEELRLSFVKQELATLLLTDSLGQRTSIELFSTRLNPSLPDSHFSFKIPEGVDVIMQ